MTSNDYSSAPWGLATAGCANGFLPLYQNPPAVPAVMQSVSGTLLSGLNALDARMYLRTLNGGGNGLNNETVRALIAKGHDVVAWEFREDTHSWAHRFRRIYNLFMGFYASAHVAVKEIRDKLVYVVVRPEDERPTLEEHLPHMMSASLSRRVANPWEYDMEDVLDDKNKKDERKLTGFICRKAYVIYKSEIDKYVRFSKWR